MDVVEDNFFKKIEKFKFYKCLQNGLDLGKEINLVSLNIIELLKDKKRLKKERNEKQLDKKIIKKDFLEKEDNTYGFFKNKKKSNDFNIDNIVRKYESLATENFDDKKFNNLENNYQSLDQKNEELDNKYQNLNEYNISNISEKSSDDVNII